MAYEYFYPGTPYSLDPEYGDLFGGYRIPVAEFGLTTDARTAMQLKEVSDKLSTGAKFFEISATGADILESIPKQQMKEINRLTKLTGTETSVHAPIVEASGYTREGWSEINREAVERQLKMAVERSHELNPDGNIPVTFHSTAMLPEALEKVKTKVGGEWKEVPKSMLIVEPRTGEIRQLKETERFFPGEETKFNPIKELEKRNQDTWTESVGNINFYAMRGEQILEEIGKIPKEAATSEAAIKKFEEAEKKLYEGYARSKKIPEGFEELSKEIKEPYEQQFKYMDHATIFLRDAYRGLRELYNMVYKEANEDDKKRLNSYAKEIGPLVEKGIEKDPEKLKGFGEIIEKGIKVLSSIQAPRIFKPLNEFIFDKSSETFSNIAFDSYQKFGDKSPLICIENPPAGSGLSRAEDLKKLIEKTRDKFVEKAVKEGIGRSEASDMSRKLIGATWDVGHINMIRKYGYEAKDVVKETEKIAPFVKHVHLSDNFGHEHTELPMGMGNVPISEIMKKLGEEGFEGKKIIEAISWWQHAKTPPLISTFEAFGSPLYTMKAPYWNQAAGTYGNYFSFPSAYMPEQHFSMYGSGFSSLPTELGGQIPGKQSRVTGTPME